MDATPEEWRLVVGYEGLYEVSDQGRVRSLDRDSTRGDGVKRRLTGRMMKAYRSPGNYDRVSLFDGLGRRHWKRVHTLVLEAFIGPRPDGAVACHNDGDHTNNRVDNLRWDTYSANNVDLVVHGTHWQARKTHCKNGHEFTPENTIIRPEGGRKCRECSLINARRQRERNRLQS